MWANIEKWDFAGTRRSVEMKHIILSAIAGLDL